jgi:ADP-ribose pyrophosphatase YjhB (NUDIX family)
MAREPLPTWFFVLVVVRKDDKFLLIQEKEHNQTWYLPAGRLKPAEALEKAAIRETLEESGVPIILDGIYRIEHTATKTVSRISTIYVAHPAADVAPISEPNEHALAARYFTVNEALQLPLRESNIIQLLHDIEQGATIHPLTVLSSEAYSGY